MRCGASSRATFKAWPSMERPPISCRILGVLDFMRVPLPAARTMTAAGFCPVLAVSMVLTEQTPLVAREAVGAIYASMYRAFRH